MAQVTWSETAQLNARAIHRYVARDSPEAAAAMVRRFRADAARLAEYPEMGRMVEEYGDPRIRELVVGSYRLIYVFEADIDRVHVLGVVHGSRMLPWLPNLP